MMGSRIAFLRQQAGMTQEALAQKIGVTAPALGSYEQARRTPSAAMIAALARELDVSADFLLTGSPGTQRELEASVGLMLLGRKNWGTRQMWALRILLELTQR